MHRLVAVPRVVADPPGIHIMVVARLNAVNDPLVVFEINILPAGVGGADRGDALEQPDPLLEQKILVQQRADRAQIDHISRQFVVAWLAGEDVDLLLESPAIDVQLGSARYLAREAHAAAAHDAAVGVEVDACLLYTSPSPRDRQKSRMPSSA